MNSPAATSTHPFAAEGYALVGAALEVHNVLGGGMMEGIYQESLEFELELRNIIYCTQQELLVFYKGKQLRRRYIPDMLVERGVVVELKSLSLILPEHQAQLINYMRIARMPVGYLLNFGPSKLEWRRFLLSEFAAPSPTTMKPK